MFKLTIKFGIGSFRVVGGVPQGFVMGLLGFDIKIIIFGRNTHLYSIRNYFI